MFADIMKLVVQHVVWLLVAVSSDFCLAARAHPQLCSLIAFPVRNAYVDH